MFLKVSYSLATGQLDITIMKRWNALYISCCIIWGRMLSIAVSCGKKKSGGMKKAPVKVEG